MVVRDLEEVRLPDAAMKVVARSVAVRHSPVVRKAIAVDVRLGLRRCVAMNAVRVRNGAIERDVRNMVRVRKPVVVRRVVAIARKRGVVTAVARDARKPAARDRDARVKLVRKVVVRKGGGRNVRLRIGKPLKSLRKLLPS